ncbi:polyprenyl synthetase family protein [Actinomadura fibrosa]|uniref:Polyprenyl synthetase family protein n=1 Tax=Actinomadura fibrosa TaxID=111802 RepID=A0ABW2XGG1_9ACTN|nr:polyprenyl synthetase family protein [Actinomadura fibrosa]
MHEQEVFRARVDRALDAFVDEEADLLLGISEGLAPVVRQLRGTLANGKRLRAAFCYWGWRATGQPDDDAMIRAAGALELVHAAAMVHDDIIDESAVRRGAPAAHVALRPVVPGPVDQGRALAILVGDMLMAWAGRLFTSSGLPAAYLGRAAALWATLARELIAGECLEILSTGRPPRVDGSLQIIRLKTAKYTVERPLHIGGVLAGARPEVMAAFTGYGVPIGEAYQLRDDVLGLFGDAADTGKSSLDDIRGAKPTVLMAAARDAAGPADLARLDRLVGDPVLTEDGLRDVREIVRRVGARDRVEAMIEQRVAAARDALAGVRLPRDATWALEQLAVAAARRQG